MSGEIILRQRINALMYNIKLMKDNKDTTNGFYDLIEATIKQRTALRPILRKIYKEDLSNKSRDKMFFCYINTNFKLQIITPEDFRKINLHKDLGEYLHYNIDFEDDQILISHIN